jgi:hypothetical protein
VEYKTRHTVRVAEAHLGEVDHDIGLQRMFLYPAIKWLQSPNWEPNRIEQRQQPLAAVGYEPLLGPCHV